MIDKYNIEFTDQVIQIDCKRLINQLWKLIPMRENDENWEAQLIVVLEEISGLGRIFNDELNFLILLSKLEGLTDKTCEDFMVYRKTIFRCIDLLAEISRHAES